MAAKEDERGFTKAEMQVWDPRQANFQETGMYYTADSIFVSALQINIIKYFIILVNLVERDHAPGGFQLVNPEESGKRNQFDLVELASTIQTVNEILLYQVTGEVYVIALCPL